MSLTAHDFLLDRLSSVLKEYDDRRQEVERVLHGERDLERCCGGRPSKPDSTVEVTDGIADGVCLDPLIQALREASEALTHAVALIEQLTNRLQCTSDVIHRPNVAATGHPRG